MGDSLEVPKGYEEWKKEFLKKQKKREMDLEESKKDLFYVA